MEEHKNGTHKALRWALGIFILIVVFLMGVKVGEFKTMLGYYGYSMWPGMMENSYYGATPYQYRDYPYGYTPMMGSRYYYGPGGMMQYYYQSAPQATTTK